MYSVQAMVTDIRSDTPKTGEQFLVDTNVWYWMTYTRASACPTTPRRYQTLDYPSYVAQIFGTGGELAYCGLALAELAHIIERAEREIFELTNSTAVRAKEYRHNHPTERQRVVNEVQAAWGQVESMGKQFDTVVDKGTTRAALARFGSHALDGYDVYSLNAYLAKSGAKILTDDGDFAVVPGLHVFTANQYVINAARSAGKLSRR